MSDLINSPIHYKGYGFEVIDFIEDLSKEIKNNNITYHIGNAIKYILRSKIKGNELQDLLKCEWYLKRIEKYCSEDNNPVILNERYIINYLVLISRKDFKIFILIENICNFALNPSKENHRIMIKNYKKYLKERV